MGVMTDQLTNDLFPQALLPITLQGPTDLEGFRRAARSLLAQNMLPEQVRWHSGNTPIRDRPARPGDAGDAPAISVPPEFLALAEATIMHSDPDRFNLLYRILWRLAHEPSLRHDPLDADMVRARQMAQAVRDEMHQMKAFMRFRRVQDDTFRSQPEGGPLHVAWFEPAHHIIEAIAPFFARRFAQMRWAILTPERSVEWDGAQLHFGPGAQQSDAPPPDAGAQRWLSCYQHIFNPARLRLKTMPKEMPRRYWKNLTEAPFMPPLPTPSSELRITMFEPAPGVRRRRIPGCQPGSAATERRQVALALGPGAS